MKSAVKRVNILDIAEKAGYSPTTVSYVLSGQSKEKRVSAKSAEKILQIAQNLNYVPNQWAQNLRRQKTGAISILFGELSYDWAGRLMQGLLEILDEHEYDAFIGLNQFDSHRERKEISSIIQRRDEGIICYPSEENYDVYKEVVSLGIPLLFLDAFCEQMPQVSYVAWDVAPAVRVLMGYLIATGHRKIALLGSHYPSWSSNVRYNTYLEVLREADCMVSEDLIHLYAEDNQIEAILKKMFSFGENRPDAIFAMNDFLAMRAVVGLNKMGIQIPKDIAVVGMGDSHQVSQIGAELTTVSQPTEEIGRQVGKTILELIKHPERAPIKRLVSGAEVKIRKTA